MFWRYGRPLFLVAATLAFGFTLIPTLNGCASDQAPVQWVADAVGIDTYRLSPGASRELSRFNTVFQTYASDPDNTRQLKHFRDAYKRIRVAYVEPVGDPQLIDAAIDAVKAQNPEPRSLPAETLVELALDGMTVALDPHSAYLNPDELRESELVTSGEFGGLGIQVSQEDGRIKVISPIDGTPAERAGIKPGDIITHLDGAPVAGMTLKQAVDAMRGAPGSRIRLTLQRGDGVPFDIVITRAIITIEPVRWSLEGDVGYLRIASFNERVADGVEAAVRAMRSSLGHMPAGIVIDLRNNPGGLLDQSLAVADDFLDSGTIVSIRGRDGRGSRAFDATAGEIAEGVPLVVLINAGSASASEIVAAALQDQGRATVMGDRSFGKGSVQTVMRLPIEGALKLTTALYYSPNGISIQALGVQPDVQITGIDQPQEQAHEVDLPGALAARSDLHPTALGSIDVNACPAVGDNRDRELGCAVMLLRAGSADKFLASRGVRTKP